MRKIHIRFYLILSLVMIISKCLVAFAMLILSHGPKTNLPLEFVNVFLLDTLTIRRVGKCLIWRPMKSLLVMMWVSMNQYFLFPPTKLGTMKWKGSLDKNILLMKISCVIDIARRSKWWYQTNYKHKARNRINGCWVASK